MSTDMTSALDRALAELQATVDDPDTICSLSHEEARAVFVELRALRAQVAATDIATSGDDRSVSRDLLVSLLDDDPCWFDHHGGCQAHGYLSLEPGELCPQAELKALLVPTDEPEEGTR